MKKLLLTPVLLLTVSGYALAADAVVVESPPEVSVVPAFNWTGGYIGGQGGYLWGEGDASGGAFGTAEIELDGWLRYVDELPSPAVDSYTELDLRLGWHATEALELSLAGQNLLHASHAEFGPATAFREEVERGWYGVALEGEVPGSAHQTRLVRPAQ